MALDWAVGSGANALLTLLRGGVAAVCALNAGSGFIADRALSGGTLALFASAELAGIVVARAVTAGELAVIALAELSGVNAERPARLGEVAFCVCDASPAAALALAASEGEPVE